MQLEYEKATFRENEKYYWTYLQMIQMGLVNIHNLSLCLHGMKVYSISKLIQYVHK